MNIQQKKLAQLDIADTVHSNNNGEDLSSPQPNKESQYFSIISQSQNSKKLNNQKEAIQDSYYSEVDKYQKEPVKLENTHASEQIYKNNTQNDIYFEMDDKNQFKAINLQVMSQTPNNKDNNDQINNFSAVDGILLSPYCDNQNDNEDWKQHDMNYLDKNDSNIRNEYADNDNIEFTLNKYPIQNQLENLYDLYSNKEDKDTIADENVEKKIKYYMELYEAEKQRSETKDIRIQELENQVKKLKNEKTLIIKDYELLIKKMVVVKDIEKEYSKISAVHKSASNELNQIKERVDKFKELQNSTISTKPISNETSGLKTQNEKEKIIDDSQSIQITKAYQKMEYNDSSHKEEYQSQVTNNPNYQTMVNSSNQKSSEHEKTNRISSVRKIRNISLSDSKPQKSLELSCDKYLRKFGTNVKKITVGDATIYKKHDKFGMNPEYYSNMQSKFQQK